jgi:hypothetical protein
LEAEARFFRGQSQMSSLLGGGVCPLEGGGGCLPACPDGGGEGEGVYGTSTLVTCLGSQGTL